ncbi:MAG: 23S rRNA (adenine(2030)-N(6))-methyltransferase RlmJ [Alphaproteobacteria bacterium]|nr:23S rRNA (adenine(2030)-N(6))-methyltransferase RlmJ [Alphaproteobacteria bacterium]
MNYRHIYHAGNICDVVKHALVTLLVGSLCAKQKGFAVLDTHAGAGLYDLADPWAQKTGEALQGIFRLLESPLIPELAPYVRVLRELNAQRADGLLYPGSPLLVQRLLRPQDRLMACELHPEDARDLKRLFRGTSQVQTHERDGYEALAAFLPPEEKRGLALIDPPFENPGEFERLASAMTALAKRWPQGHVLIWYPVKERPAIWRFHEALRSSGFSSLLCAEFIYAEETRHDRLNGSGFILANPPWQFDARVKRLFPALHQALKTETRKHTVTWLKEENA